MKKFLIFIIVLLSTISHAQTCNITSDALPPAVNAGTTHNFTTNCVSPTWNMSGLGSIGATTGVYTAPATVWAQDVSRGRQLLPNSSVYKLPIGGLSPFPVAAGSSNYLQRIADQNSIDPGLPAGFLTAVSQINTPGSGCSSGDILNIVQGAATNGKAYVDTVNGSGGVTSIVLAQIGQGYSSAPGVTTSGGTCTVHPTVTIAATVAPSFHRFHMAQWGWILYYDNIINNSTPTQTMHFSNSGFPGNGANFPLQNPLTHNQAGYSLDWGTVGSPANSAFQIDNHYGEVNTDNGDDTEAYQLYVDMKTSAVLPGNPTLINFTSDTIRTLQNPLRIWITITGSCAVLNGSYNATVVSWTPTVGGQLSVPVNTTGLTCLPTYIGTKNNGCATCNTGNVVTWHNWSNALQPANGAGGSPISALSLHAEEWYNATQQAILDPACNCVTLGHALLSTLTNNELSPIQVWPAVINATFGHPIMRITAATRANPTIFTTTTDMAVFTPCRLYTYIPTCTFPIVVANMGTGWASFNGRKTGTVIDSTHFSVAIDSTSFPSLPVGGTYTFDWSPYGMAYRLKSTFDVSGFCAPTALTDPCPYEKVLLNTLKVYGWRVNDGSFAIQNWQIGVVSDEFDPDLFVTAAATLTTTSALANIESNLEAVDISGAQINFSPPYTNLNNQLGETTNNQTVITVSQSGFTSSSISVQNQGAAVGANYSRIAIPTGFTYQINAWVTGTANNTASYSIAECAPVTCLSSGANVSSSGLITAPSTLSAVTRTIVTITSTDDSTANYYVSVYFIPKASNGNIYLAYGNLGTSYTDTSSNVWWGQVVTRAFNSNYEIGDGIDFANLDGTWTAHSSNWMSWVGSDPQLYAQSMSSINDTTLNIALPNGNYNLTFYGEPGFGTSAASQNVYDIEINDVVVSSYNDGFLLAGGLYQGYNLGPFAAVVNNGVLQFTQRIRELSTSYGQSGSSLLIVPTSPLVHPGYNNLTLNNVFIQ